MTPKRALQLTPPNPYRRAKNLLPSFAKNLEHDPTRIGLRKAVAAELRAYHANENPLTEAQVAKLKKFLEKTDQL